MLLLYLSVAQCAEYSVIWIYTPYILYSVLKFSNGISHAADIVAVNFEMDSERLLVLSNRVSGYFVKIVIFQKLLAFTSKYIFIKIN